MTDALNSLGFAKPPAQTRVVAAMSGGVDSSVVAGLLAREGYEVVGVTLQLYDHGAAVKKKGACCAGQDIHDAKRVAERLGISHYVLDYEERFRRQVMQDFADSYARGETPIPCVRCNERVKFGDLLNLARELGADALATGHYVRRVAGRSGPELHSASDATRDQSYFLFATTGPQLEMLRFPLGDMPKARVREIADELGLLVAAKPDSQDICFVPQGRYSDVVARLRPGAAEPGEIVDVEGRVLGSHAGIIHFTVGQRKGLGLSGNEEPLFVVRLDAASRRVVVGPREALRIRIVTLAHVNWLADFAGGPVSCLVKLRSTAALRPARVTPCKDGGAEVELAGGEDAVAPGQACVFYEENGTRVLGGGWIVRTQPGSTGQSGRNVADVALAGA
ncbi:MAG TPA: tRNA 2-thiouridine(34) synthase MnmA [Micropepsaceae bacterium]|jgi:tRNA-specific 2-thiouridylase|nr:tRNA 2-thiouridine(34) synthase MnmA [Micropepsaceae bacterium]